MLSLLPYFWIHGRISFILLCCTGYFIGFPQTIDSSISIEGIILMLDNVMISEINCLSKKDKAYSTGFSGKPAGETLTPAKQYNDRLQEAAFVNMAEGCLFNDACEKAFLCISEALDNFNQLPIPSHTALTFSSLVWLCNDLEDPSNVLYSRPRALDISPDYYDKYHVINMLNAVRPIGLPGEKSDKAVSRFKELPAPGPAIDNNKEKISESSGNLGAAALESGHCRELLRFNISYEISKSLNNSLRRAKTLNHISPVLIRLKRYESEKHLLTAENQEPSRSNPKKEVLFENALTGADLYEALGDYRLQLKYLRRYQKIRKEILPTEKRNESARVQISYENTKVRKEVSVHPENEKKPWHLHRNTWLAAMALFSISVYALFVKLRIDHRKERQLSAAREDLMSKVLEKEKSEKEILYSKLEHKSSQMTGFALHISQQNILLKSFLDELVKVQSLASHEVASKLAKAIQQFGQLQELNKDTEDFHLNVEAGYKDFFFNLTQAYPDLTENEKRLCSQIRLNLTIKDIATINNISVKSVEMARYRLRKRFKISHEENLTEWLKQF